MRRVLHNLKARFWGWRAATQAFVLGVVDLPRLKAANGWADRARSVDWIRFGVLAAPIAMVAVGAVIVLEITGPKAYPPPLPTAEEIETRRGLIEAAAPTPPAALAERNKSVGAPS